jgi:hypothetical protein
MRTGTEPLPNGERTGTGKRGYRDKQMASPEVSAGSASSSAVAPGYRIVGMEEFLTPNRVCGTASQIAASHLQASALMAI